MTGNTATELLPLDPAVPGLWWVVDRNGQYDVWRWWPTSRLWLDTLGARIAASSAHAAGWRCEAAAVPPSPWQPIASAPMDGTVVLVHAPAYEDLDAITCTAAWHPDAGWCVDELRCVEWWVLLPLLPADARTGHPDRPPQEHCDLPVTVGNVLGGSKAQGSP